MKMNKLSQAIIAVAAGLSASSAFSQSDSATSEAPDEVIVQGFRASLAKAADQKRAADSIQDSIVAEDIGKMPDQNVAESLQRITGVTISRTNGEGSKITVRGFGPQFNVVKLNDRTLATTGGGRDFDFQVLPSELIAGADVIKSPTAKLAAGSIGGYVNIRTARPLDNTGFHVAGSVNAKYQDLEEKVNPDVSAVVSDTFADETIGVLLGVSYKNTDARIDQYRTNNWGEYSGSTGGKTGYGFPMPKASVMGEDGKPTTLAGSRGPGRSIFEMNNENRERVGGNAVIQWAPSDAFESTLDVLYTKLTRENLGSGLQVANQANLYTAASVSNSGTLRSATLSNSDMEAIVDYGLEEDTTKAFGYNAVFKQDKLTLKADLSYSTAKGAWQGDNSTVLHYTRFNADGSLHPSAISLNYTHDIPDMTLTGLNLTDISSLRAAWQRYAATESEDTVKEAKLDAKYDIDNSVVKSLELGTAYSNRNVSFSKFGTEFDMNTGGETWSGSGMWIGDGSNYGGASTVGKLDNSVFKLTANNFMDGVGGNFPRQWVQVKSDKAYRAATQAYLEQLIKTEPGRAAVVNAGWDTVYPSAGGGYSNEENSLSTYFQLNLGGDLGDMSWTGNVGGRYVSIVNETTGTASTIDLLTLESPQKPYRNSAITSAKKSTVKTSEDFFLPSANFSLNVNDGNYVRLGMAETITRPALSDAGANVSESAGVNSATVNISGGNPYLTSYKVNQLDLSFEHYDEGGSAYSAGYFYKDISSFISTITTTGPWLGSMSPELAAAYKETGQVVSYISNRKENRKGGTVQGLELGALHNFDNLPGIWSGLGVQANYTYATSKDKDAAPINQPGVIEPGSGLEGFAKNSYNLVGFYEKDGIQLRLGYNWRDSFMNSRSGDGISPEYTDAYGQWDFSSSYAINDNLTVSFEVTNLTNETRLQYLGQRDRVDLVEMSGSRYQLGLRATF